MRRWMLGLGLAAVLAGCGPEEPKAAESRKVVEAADNPGATWPLLLQHCLRSPGCDPMSNFGQGAGQASGVVEQATWVAETAEAVKEGGQDYGASIKLNLYATRGQGGKAGRPLTIDETVSNLRGMNARRSTLSIEYRTPGGGAPEPYGLASTSAQLALAAPDIKTATTQEKLAELTQVHVDKMKWPNGEGGAKIEIAGKAGVVFTGYSWGIAAADISDNEEAVQRGFEPWVFYVPQNIRDEPVKELLDAIGAGETLSVKITSPDGGVMLTDAIYTAGYAEARRQATEALKDQELARTIPERCARFEKEKQEFWKIADVTAALRVCDPRTDQQRRLDEQLVNAPASAAQGQ
jgi:hypothetical protein